MYIIVCTKKEAKVTNSGKNGTGGRKKEKNKAHSRK